jgi:hypothetical protein
VLISGKHLIGYQRAKTDTRRQRHGSGRKLWRQSTSLEKWLIDAPVFNRTRPFPNHLTHNEYFSGAGKNGIAFSSYPTF